MDREEKGRYVGKGKGERRCREETGSEVRREDKGVGNPRDMDG